MRILLLTHYFEPENGAPQRRWSALIERFVDAGHVVDVLAPPPHYPSGRIRSEHRELRPGTVQRTRSGGLVRRVGYLQHSGDLLTRTLDHVATAADSYRHAARAIRGGRRPDVVIATAPALESLIAGRLLAHRFRVPLVAEMRDAWPDLVAHTPGLVSPTRPTAFLKRAVHGFVTRLQRRADAVVTTTATFAAILERRGIARVRVLRNGTDLQRYRVVGPAELAPGDALRALYIGTIGRSQGLDLLIRAAARLRADGVAVELRIAGQGADVGRLRRLNQRLGEPAEILGQIDGSEVIEQYQWAHTTVVSLRDWEPFAWTVPSKLYELLAAGKHITGIVAGEAADILREAAAGHIVAPGDVEALVRLWARLAADRALLRIDGTGREWVQGHADYDRIAGQYMQLLDAVVAPTA
ncbi:glycosyltransferase family 4 protein [Agrococcus sp. BE272]|uniref:glycosyltransferase family 4 protein n=1 Tax=Agrococcus sp. BE272 TaxID=2817727 RepID=UPI0028650CF6|nr:glycosyltransferase family 4 protein [Agrococcus sp. BE272]MDR7233170.1 glycosyltransferase involved in cell wall biosynthesis [Agrococcus sp. BE272]